MKINGERLLSRLSRLSEIGRTVEGGVTRLALSPEDIAARTLVLEWAKARGYVSSRDAAGNLFITRPGADKDRLPILTGSHLDTQRNGGNLDGIYGVLAGFEVLESLDDNDRETKGPVSLCIWNNEEGVRYSPVTMGSAIWSGKLDLSQLESQEDKEGISLADALRRDLFDLDGLQVARLGEPFRHYVELHIEQGPVLEAKDSPIGLVTGIQGVRQFSFRVQGRAAHAGTTPVSMRKDAFAAAIELYHHLAGVAGVGEDDVYFTVGRFEVLPGTPNTVPANVGFTVDLRSSDPDKLAERGERMFSVSGTTLSGCEITVEELIYSRQVDFDPVVMASIEIAIRSEGLIATRLPSGATHDAINVARLGPAGMIFVPSRGGISHNPEEWTDPEHLVAGCQALAGTLLNLDAIEDVN